MPVTPVSFEELSYCNNCRDARAFVRSIDVDPVQATGRDRWFWAMFRQPYVATILVEGQYHAKVKMSHRPKIGEEIDIIVSESSPDDVRSDTF